MKIILKVPNPLLAAISKEFELMQGHPPNDGMQWGILKLYFDSLMDDAHGNEIVEAMVERYITEKVRS
jgi:hypothetical protein